MVDVNMPRQLLHQMENPPRLYWLEVKGPFGEWSFFAVGWFASIQQVVAQLKKHQKENPRAEFRYKSCSLEHIRGGARV